jgi:hypothetical protein
MEAQTCIHLAGGISEAIRRGERRPHGVLRFAESCCAIDEDLRRADDVLRELRRLTGYRFEARDFVEPTMTLGLQHWGSVTAPAEALVESGRIEGERVEEIIDRSLYRRGS